MTKQQIINITIIVGILGLLAYQILNKEKTVYVDVGVLMQEYKGMKVARAEYEKQAAQWQANTDTLISQFQEQLKSYEKERSSMTKKEKELKEELLRNKQMQVNQYQEAIKLKAPISEV